MNDPDTPPGTVELAENAAQHVHELNHRTHGPDAFTGPAQLYNASKRPAAPMPVPTHMLTMP